MGKVLLVGFRPRDEKRVTSYFRTVDVHCDSAATMEIALQKIPKDPPTLVVADRPSRIEEIYGLKDVLAQSAPATPFLVIISDESVEMAMPALRAGAYDCVSRPIDKTQLLAAAKRASLRNGRTLFVPKIRIRKRRAGLVGAMVLGFLVSVSVFSLGTRRSPAPALNLGSATVSGIQWTGRRLWVGNWYESTVTLYELGRSAFSRSTKLLPREVIRLPDVQPILICDIPAAFVTVGFDLMIRSHNRAPGLPVEWSEKTPGTNPTGIAWDGKFLWTCDGNTGLLYRHGPDLQVIETVPSIVRNPSGMTSDGKNLWVIGGDPLRAAKLERRRHGYVWKGPFPASDLVSDGVPPSGLAFGYRRLWASTGGDPVMKSIPASLRGIPERWKRPVVKP